MEPSPAPLGSNTPHPSPRHPSGSFTTLKMRIKVHAPMQHTLHDELRIIELIEHHMPTDEHRSISISNLGTIPSTLGRIGARIHHNTKLIEVPIGLSLSKLLTCPAPDRDEIVMRRITNQQPTAHDADRPVSPRARRLIDSISSIPATPLSSPATSARRSDSTWRSCSSSSRKPDRMTSAAFA